MQESFQQKEKNVQESLAMQLVSGEAVGMAAMILKFEIIERRISKLEALGDGCWALWSLVLFDLV